MEFEIENQSNHLIQSREFGHGCFSISSFFSFLMVVMMTIVNVNNNMNTVSFYYIIFHVLIFW